jgi:hypothetical protein
MSRDLPCVVVVVCVAHAAVEVCGCTFTPPLQVLPQLGQRVDMAAHMNCSQPLPLPGATIAAAVQLRPRPCTS